MPYAYVTVEEIKSTAVINTTSTAHDARLGSLAQHITTQIDRFTNRRFQSLIEVRYFDGNAKTALVVSDLIAVPTNGLKEDSNGDGTFDTTWNANDFHLTPHNAAPTSDWGRPYNSIRVNPASIGTQDAFLGGFRNYEITGTWGWSAVLTTLVVVLSGDHNSATSTLLISGTPGGTIDTGDTILLGTEQMFVDAVASSTNQITVTRAVNGASAGSHGSATEISVYRYPGPIVEACLMQSIRFWTRRNSGFSDESGFQETGRRIQVRGLDPDVKEMLASYRKIAI